MRTGAKWLTSSDERAARTAAHDLQKLHLELADLPVGWFVLHSIEIEGHDRPIDHLVIGPGGVFTIGVEHHYGAKVWVSVHNVTINGRDDDHLRRARFAARRSGGLLTDACGFDVTAQSVLVLIGASAVQTLSRPAEVHVRTQHDLRDWLCRQPVRLDTEAATTISERANRVETWLSSDTG